MDTLEFIKSGIDQVIEQGRADRRAGINIKTPPREIPNLLVIHWQRGWAREHDEIKIAENLRLARAQ